MKVSSISLGPSALDPETIVNLYLYGTTSAPVQLYDRLKTQVYLNSLTTVNTATGPVPTVTVNIDAGAYLSSGAGRFAKLAANPVVEAFFNLPDLLVAPGLNESFSEMAARLNMPFSSDPDSPSFQIEHLFLDDGVNDIPDRPFVFNNSSFLVRTTQDGDELRFKVLPDGSRVIENAGIRAFDDNFDFSGGSLGSLAFNLAFENSIDPYRIGTRVEFDFDNSSAAIDPVYTRQEFEAEKQFLLNSLSTLPVASVSDGFVLVDRLTTNGTLLFEAGPYAIVYGGPKSQELDATDAANSTNDRVLILAGEGEDKVFGFDQADRLYGHEGSDKLFGAAGADIIVGGSGDDFAQGGDGNDRIFGDDSSENFEGAEEPNVVFGDDWLRGGDGKDTLRGGQGDDILEGQQGRDNLRGGEGNDLRLRRNISKTLRMKSLHPARFAAKTGTTFLLPMPGAIRCVEAGTTMLSSAELPTTFYAVAGSPT